MTDNTKVYIAGMGMITPLGDSVEKTAAAVRAGISGYQVSDYDNQQGQPITMAGVPEDIFADMDVQIDEGDYYCEQYDRIIKMAIFALQQTVDASGLAEPVPLILAMPEVLPDIKQMSTETLVTNLLNQGLPIEVDTTRFINTGRAAGIQALDLAQRNLYDLDVDFVLVGGSDSYWHYPLLAQLDKSERLLAPESMNGFAPGEGAAFMLLTRHPEKAMVKDGHIVALHQPGVSEEAGHLSSEQPYRGDGLSDAFKQALSIVPNKKINTVYGSLNGENFWAKEYGVAMMRNHRYFQDDTRLEHPADCYGDPGAASGLILMAMAAENLLKQEGVDTNLVYSSSDGAWRAAILMEKLALNSVHNRGTDK